MPASEMLARAARTGGALTYLKQDIECSSARAPWRDLLRLESGSKLAAESEIFSVWAGFSIIRADSGILEQRVNRGALEVLSLSAGSVLTWPERAVIQGRAAQPIDAVCIQLSPGVLDAASRELRKPAALAAAWRPRDEPLERFAAQLEGELRAGCPNGFAYGRHLAHAIAVYLLNGYGGTRASGRRHKISAALEYIQSGAQDLRIEKLAAVSHLSLYHFSRLFKQSTGLAPHQYVLHWRIEEAKRLLARSELDLAEIAQRLGFRDQSHFTERFRKVSGVTPKRWRDKAHS